jgi:hypothetical protein
MSMLNVRLFAVLSLMPACVSAEQTPQPTQPFLASAVPDPRQVLVVDTQALESSDAPIVFSATVTSFDQQPIESRLYIDYGSFSHGPAGPPFVASLPGSTLGAGPPGATSGTITAEWFPNMVQVDPGCHTATLMVSHQFDDGPGGLGCPTCDSDSSAITWQVLRCDSAVGNCSELPLEACEALTNSCARVRGDAGAEDCPGP